MATGTLRSWVILAALALARVAVGYQFQTVATLGTELVQRFGLSYAQLGSLIGAYMLLGVFVALPLGLLGRRFGDRLVLGAGLALMTAGSCISAWADGATGIAAGRSLAGVGAVAMIVLQGKVIADWFVGARFMIGISVSVCAFPIGMGLAQIVLPSVLMRFGLHAAFLTDAVPAGLALLLFVLRYRVGANACCWRSRGAFGQSTPRAFHHSHHICRAACRVVATAWGSPRWL